MTAHGGSRNVVWSRVGSDGRSRLVQRIKSRNRDLPVRPKAGLFDPDIGTGARGNQVIVYTRCAGLSGKNCDVWQYDGFDRKERKVPGASSARCSEFAPSVWIATVAFARSGPAGCNGLYIAQTGEGHEARRTRAGGDRPARAPRCLPPHSAERQDPHLSADQGRAGRKSRVVVTGFAADGESYRVSNPFLDSHYSTGSNRTGRNEFFAGRAAATAAPCWSSPPACSRGWSSRWRSRGPASST